MDHEMVEMEHHEAPYYFYTLLTCAFRYLQRHQDATPLHSFDG